MAIEFELLLKEFVFDGSSTRWRASATMEDGSVVPKVRILNPEDDEPLIAIHPILFPCDAGEPSQDLLRSTLGYGKHCTIIEVSIFNEYEFSRFLPKEGHERFRWFVVQREPQAPVPAKTVKSLLDYEKE